MSTQIMCPSCGHEFEPNDAIRDEVQKELRAQMADWKKKKEDEFRKREAEVAAQVEEHTRRQMVSDFEVRMRFLEN